MEEVCHEDWGRLAADLHSGGDDAIDRLANAALSAPDSNASPALIRALGLACSESTKRAAALALANSAGSEDPDAADALDDAYRETRKNVSLGPVLLKALSLFGLRSTPARAAASSAIQKLRPDDSSYLLMAAAKAIGLLAGQRDDTDLRRKLSSLTESEDPGVECEAHQQLALLILGDAFQATTLDDVVEKLKEARDEFAAAEELEEVRPDAKLFGNLVDLVLRFDALASGSESNLNEVRELAAKIRLGVGGLSQRVFQGYRSDAANRLAERALTIADSLSLTVEELVEAKVWVELNKSVVALAEAYTAVFSQPAAFLGQERVEAALGNVAEGVMRPRLGPVLMRFVGRDRLARIIDRYEKQGGDRAVLRSLRVLEEVANASEAESGKRLSPDKHAELAALAEKAGMTPDELVSDIAIVIQLGETEGWAVRMGLTSPVFEHLPQRNRLEFRR